MRAFVFGLALFVGVALPVFADEGEIKNDEPPRVGPTYTESVALKMATRLGRGIVNVLTAIVELPKQMVETGHEKGFWTGISLGFLKGCVMTVVRLGAGAFETLFFLTPWPDDWKPVLDPEFVWE